MMGDEKAGVLATGVPTLVGLPVGQRGVGPGMRFYGEVARRSFRRELAYPAANLAGMATNTFWGVVRAAIFTAIFTVRPHAAGYTLTTALTYGWLTEALLMVVVLWGWTEVAEAVRTGDLVTDMARPYHYQTYWLCRDLGRALFFALFRAMPIVVIAAVVYPFAPPRDPLAGALFLVSAALGVVVSFAWRFLVNLTAFWTTDVRGVAAMAGLVGVFFSGDQMPLAFLPAGLRAVAGALPFPSMVAVPMDVYLGRTIGLQALLALAGQAAWAVALLALGRWVLALGYRTVAAHGG